MTGMPFSPGDIQSSVLVNQPLYLEPAFARAFFYHQLRHAGLDVSDWEPQEKPRQRAITHEAEISDTYRYRIQDGVAIVPVVGPLTHRGSMFFGMGYRQLAATIHTAMRDEEVRGVLLDMETPGGSANGCFDFAATLQKWGAEKPIWALVNDMATSAGQAISSAAERRIITQSGMTGSVGVVMLHVDYSAMLKTSGVKPTFVFSGGHKVDGNAFQALPAEVRGRWQEELDSARLQFAELVAGNIGLQVDAVLDTEAQVYTGQDAIDIGLADDLMNSYEVIGEFADYLSPRNPSTLRTGTTMSKQERIAAEAPQPKPEASNHQHQPGGDDNDPPPAPAAAEAPTGADAAAVAQAERQRIAGILGHEKATGLTALANSLAYDVGLDAELAGKVIEAAASDLAAAKETQAQRDPLGQLMAHEDHPDVPSDGDGGGTPDATASELDDVAGYLAPVHG